jgi:hypothetical protein
MLLALSAAALALTTNFSAVQIPERYPEALSNRYPAWAVMNRRSAWARLDVVARPDGSIMFCRVADFGGSERLAKEFCAVIWNIRLEPARGADGSPVHGYTRLHMAFVSQGGREARDVMTSERQADITIGVDGAPPADGPRPGFGIALLVEPDGTVAGCEPGYELFPSGGEPRNAVSAAFVAQACAQVVGTKRSRILADDGSAVPYVGVLHVRME